MPFILKSLLVFAIVAVVVAAAAYGLVRLIRRREDTSPTAPSDRKDADDPILRLEIEMSVHAQRPNTTVTTYVGDTPTGITLFSDIVDAHNKLRYLLLEKSEGDLYSRAILVYVEGVFQQGRPCGTQRVDPERCRNLERRIRDVRERGPRTVFLGTNGSVQTRFWSEDEERGIS